MERSKVTASTTSLLKLLCNTCGHNGRTGQRPVIILGKNISQGIAQTYMTFTTGRNTSNWKLLEIWASI
jgi:hypothetical protein